MRRSNRSKFLALFLSFAFAVQLLPTMALASESTDEPLIKEAGYQDFPAYYSDSAHADNQVTHPDVVVLNTQNKRVWIAYVQYWVLMLREFKGIGSKSKTLAEFA